VVDTAKHKLLAHQRKANAAEKKIERKLDQVQERVSSSSKSYDELKQQIAKRAQLLVTAVSESERELLKQLEESFDAAAAPMQKSKRCAEKKLSGVHALKQELETALNESSTIQMLNMSRDMFSGQGSLQKLMVQSKQQYDHPVLLWTADELQRDIIKKTLGQVRMFKVVTKNLFSLIVLEKFQVGDNKDWYIFSIHIDGASVYAAQGKGGDSDEGCVSNIALALETSTPAN
jgi:replicative DNA helicase